MTEEQLEQILKNLREPGQVRMSRVQLIEIIHYTLKLRDDLAQMTGINLFLHSAVQSQQIRFSRN